MTTPSKATLLQSSLRTKALVAFATVIALVGALTPTANAQQPGGTPLFGVVSHQGVRLYDVAVFELDETTFVTTNSFGEFAILIPDTTDPANVELAVYLPLTPSFPEVAYFVERIDTVDGNFVTLDFRNDLIQLEVTVVDEQGNLIDGATVEIFGNDSYDNVGGGDGFPVWTNSGLTSNGTVTLPVLDPTRPLQPNGFGSNQIEVFYDGRSTNAQIFQGTTDVTVVFPDPPVFCAGSVVTVDLAAGELPTSGDDVILGTDGDDVINARGGDDIVCAGPGDDVITAGAGDDRVRGGNGNDTINTGAGNDRAAGGPGEDRIIGGRGDDVLRGDGGDDVLNGGKDDDNLEGGDGEDLLIGENGGDWLRGGFKGDDLRGGKGRDVLQGNNGGDVLGGGGGDDIVEGGFGKDELNGGGGTNECEVDPDGRNEIVLNCIPAL